MYRLLAKAGLLVLCLMLVAPAFGQGVAVRLIQPSAGVINLDPQAAQYEPGTTVTATVVPWPGYRFCGWLGDLDGESASATFAVQERMVIGAEVCADPSENPPGRLIMVATASALKDAVGAALPGDVIEVADGVYNWGSTLSVRRGGVEGYPVTIRARNRGAVEITGGSSFVLKQVAWVTIEGFLFTSTDRTAVKAESARHTRITRNTFRLQETESLKWVLIGGTYDLWVPFSEHNRIDHNLFEGKSQPGNMITIDGSPKPEPLSSQYDRIDHNYFRNVGPRIENGMETIRLGWSAMSMSSGFTTVEANLFEACDGDPEIVSVKTSDNTLRYNTFRRSQGTLSLRHGNRNEAYANFFFGEERAGTGGIRLYGDDNRVFNNYMEGLDGTGMDAPIALTNGDADYASTSDLTKHFRSRRPFIGFNTLVGNRSGLEVGYVGSSYRKGPQDAVIVNNLVTGDRGALIRVYTPPEGAVWQGNLVWPTGSATAGVSMPEGQVRLADPLLVRDAALWRPSEASPLIDAAAGSYLFVDRDMDGQVRLLPDIGADERQAGEPLAGPLLPREVGPDGPEFAVSAVLPSQAEGSLPDALQLDVYPNPFAGQATLRFHTPSAGTVRLDLYDVLGRHVARPAEGFFPAGVHEVDFDSASLPSGPYFVLLHASGRARTTAAFHLQ